MGRSVSYPSGAAAVTFDDIEEWDDWTWDDLVDAFRHQLGQLWPSVSEDDKWIGREDHVLASNGHALFGMSEYGGIVSYWMVPREWDGYLPDTSALHEAWCRRAAQKFDETFGSMRKVGVFSNGGGVYAPKTPHDRRPDNIDTDQGHLVINGLLTDG